MIRQILSSSDWPEVVILPYRLMDDARVLRDPAPIKAGLKEQKSCAAIALLTVAPVRCGNLAEIKLEENLIRPGGPDQPFWLIFPEYDVKNRIRLEFPLDKVARLLSSKNTSTNTVRFCCAVLISAGCFREPPASTRTRLRAQ